LITSLKDEHGKIVAYCEWRLVGPSGYEIENGEYVWVNDIWVHGEFRHAGKLNRIIDEIMRDTPQAKYCYFTRGKYGERMKMFTRAQWERRRKAYEQV
jgi:hypothetical protein